RAGWCRRTCRRRRCRRARSGFSARADRPAGAFPGRPSRPAWALRCTYQRARLRARWWRVPPGPLGGPARAARRGGRLRAGGGGGGVGGGVGGGRAGGGAPPRRRPAGPAPAVIAADRRKNSRRPIVRGSLVPRLPIVRLPTLRVCILASSREVAPASIVRAR